MRCIVGWAGLHAIRKSIRYLNIGVFSIEIGSREWGRKIEIGSRKWGRDK